MKTFYKQIKNFFSGDFNQLLIFLVLLFVFRPYGFGLNYITIWHLFFSGVLLTAIFNCHLSPIIKIAAITIGLPTLMVNWLTLFIKNEALHTASIILSLFFLIFSIFSLLNRVLLGKVTADILRGTVCVYFMIGFAFSFIYGLFLTLYPDTAFKGLPENITALKFFSEGLYHDMIYFSFVTLISIGYGDIVPTNNPSQIAAICEGIIGQFYLAILVARIVTTYARRAQAASVKGTK